MTTSGTTAFSLPLDELFEEAFARIGGEPTPAQEWRQAKRTLDLLFTDMMNRGFLLWTIEQTSVTLVASTLSYTLATDTLDVVQVDYRGTNNIDLPMERIPYEEYMTIAKKSTTANRTTSWALDRQRDAPVLYVYPGPNATAAGGSLIVWRVRFIQDAGSLTNTPDVPRRFYPSLVSGLAYFLSLKRPGIDPDRVIMLKQTYLEDLENALDEDRDRAPARWVPRRRPL